MVVSFTYENPYFSLASLIFVCLVIGMQLANQVIMVSEIHHNVASNVRATSISVFNMLCRGLGGVVLGIFKNVSSSHGFNNGFAYWGVIFIVIAIFLIYEIKKMNIANMLPAGPAPTITTSYIFFMIVSSSRSMQPPLHRSQTESPQWYY